MHVPVETIGQPHRHPFVNTQHLLEDPWIPGRDRSWFGASAFQENSSEVPKRQNGQIKSGWSAQPFQRFKCGTKPLDTLVQPTEFLDDAVHLPFSIRLEPQRVSSAVQIDAELIRHSRTDLWMEVADNHREFRRGLAAFAQNLGVRVVGVSQRLTRGHPPDAAADCVRRAVGPWDRRRELEPDVLGDDVTDVRYFEHTQGLSIRHLPKRHQRRDSPSAAPHVVDFGILHWLGLEVVPLVVSFVGCLVWTPETRGDLHHVQYSSCLQWQGKDADISKPRGKVARDQVLQPLPGAVDWIDAIVPPHRKASLLNYPVDTYAAIRVSEGRDILCDLDWLVWIDRRTRLVVKVDVLLIPFLDHAINISESRRYQQGWHSTTIMRLFEA